MMKLNLAFSREGVTMRDGIRVARADTTGRVAEDRVIASDRPRAFAIRHLGVRWLTMALISAALGHL